MKNGWSVNVRELFVVVVPPVMLNVWIETPFVPHEPLNSTCAMSADAVVVLSVG